MLVNINGVNAADIRGLVTYTHSQPDNAVLKDFPVLVVDRYSGITGLMIWARVGEEVGVEGGCYSAHIGAFCPISNQVRFLVDVNHDYESVSMSGQVPDLIPCAGRKRRKGSIIIQNDVWIGYGVTVLGGVTIHNGAVIAANSTVTKDVPPYAIVAGSPARVIKYRFDPETIEQLQRIQWWYWDEKTIKSRKAWFRRPAEEFAKKFDVSAGEGHLSSEKRLTDLPFDEIARENRYLIFSDLDRPHSVVRKVIKAFALSHGEESCLVVSVPKDGREEKNVRAVCEFAEGLNSECGLYVRCTGKKEIPALTAACGSLITSRVLELVRYTCIADLTHTNVISGVDVPVFGD